MKKNIKTIFAFSLVCFLISLVFAPPPPLNSKEEVEESMENANEKKNPISRIAEGDNSFCQNSLYDAMKVRNLCANMDVEVVGTVSLGQISRIKNEIVEMDDISYRRAPVEGVKVCLIADNQTDETETILFDIPPPMNSKFFAESEVLAVGKLVDNLETRQLDLLFKRPTPEGVFSS